MHNKSNPSSIPYPEPATLRGCFLRARYPVLRVGSAQSIQISELCGTPEDMLNQAKQQLDSLVNKLDDNSLNTKTQNNTDQQCSNEIIDKQEMFVKHVCPQ